MEFPGEKNGRLTIGIIIGIILGASGGWWFGWMKGKEQVRVEAVRVNHARYRILDEYGTISFEWMPNGTAPQDKK